MKNHLLPIPPGVLVHSWICARGSCVLHSVRGEFRLTIYRRNKQRRWRVVFSVPIPDTAIHVAVDFLLEAANV